MGLVEYIHEDLVTLDYAKTNVKFKLVGASTLFFGILYLASSFVSNMLWTYRNLRTKEKVFWNLAVVRGVYGIFCTTAGLWAFFIDTELEKDVVFATSPTSYFAICCTVGFFVFECSMLLWSDFYYKQSNKLLNLHHWISLVGYTLILFEGSTHFFGARGLILEMSTPFSCLCWTLLKADFADSFLWRANQFLLVHTFHLRSVVEWSLWYMTVKHWSYIWEAMPTSMFMVFYVQLTLVTFIMTPYWTYKKTVQMINPVDWNFEDAAKNKAQNGNVKKE